MPDDDAVHDAKQAWRSRVWTEMSEARVARFPGARGRIPNFTGAEGAAARTTIVTTVHPLQVAEADLPETDHDFRVDLIVTPEDVIRCPEAPRPPGVLWGDLDRDKIAAVPALAERERQV